MLKFSNDQKIEYLKKKGYVIKNINLPGPYSDPFGKFKIKLNYENSKEYDVVYLKDSESHTIINFITTHKISEDTIPVQLFGSTTGYKNFIDSISIDTIFNEVITKDILKQL